MVGKLVDDDFDRIGGQKDKLIGVVQEKYGYAREKAQQEVERRFKEYGDKMSGSDNSGRQDTAAAVAGGPANAPNEGPIATTVAAVADGVESAQGAISTAATAVADGWESAQGAISTAATAVADGVGSASSYLQEKKFEEMATDLTALIRQYPVNRYWLAWALAISWPDLPRGKPMDNRFPGLQRRAWRRCLAAS